jgi:hypothetical protein
MFPFFGSPSLFHNGTGPSYLTQAYLLQHCSWVESLIIGDRQNEGNVLFNLLRGRDPSAFVSLLLSTFGSSAANKILDTCHISPAMDPHPIFHIPDAFSRRYLLYRAHALPSPTI